MTRELEEFASGFAYLEGPRWHDGRLWVSDFYQACVFSIDADGSSRRVAQVPGQPSGLGWLPDGRMLVVLMIDRRILRLESNGELVTHADLSHHVAQPLNDMVVDAETGRLYVGCFGFDVMNAESEVRPTVMIAVEPDGTSRIVADGLYFPNGAVITQDRSTLIVGETFGNRVSAFTIAADGSLGPRRDWAAWGSLPDSKDMAVLGAATAVGADGLAMDPDGAMWIADCFHQRAVKVVEGGEIVDEVSTGEDNCFAVAVGGPTGRELFLMVAPNFFESERRTTRLGRILRTYL